jgi:hypothetical protein
VLTAVPPYFVRIDHLSIPPGCPPTGMVVSLLDRVNLFCIESACALFRVP